MSVYKKLRDIYLQSFFFPGWIGIFTNPFYFSRKGLVQHIASLAVHVRGRTLDVGCGNKPYEKLYCSKEYVGLEIDTPKNRIDKNADYFYDGNVFPFEDNSFDSLVANEVFEHVFNPENFLNEMARVLKPGGTVLMTMPFVWDEHEQPHDFARYTSFGIRHLLEKHGFVVVDQRKSMCDVRVLFQLLNAYVYKRTVTKNAWINLLLTLILMAPINIVGELFSLITPRNVDLYLDNVVLARRGVTDA